MSPHLTHRIPPGAFTQSAFGELFSFDGMARRAQYRNIVGAQVGSQQPRYNDGVLTIAPQIERR
jgi:hypothetical protein